MQVEKTPRFTRLDWLVFVLLTCMSGAAFFYFLRDWFSFEDWRTHPGVFLLLTFILLFKTANSLARWATLPLMKLPLHIAPRKGLKVAVVTTIVPGSESLEMLEETLRAMAALDYPHDAWVLDEGDDEEVKTICRRNGALHFSRKSSPHYQTESGQYQVRSKHGNYNAWLEEIGFHRYQIITAFDPDHAPASDFLSKTLGYFEDPSIGYVQAAQAYYNQSASFIARGAAEETYEYYSCSQMAAFHFDQPAVVGCHNTHRVTALREVGGFAAHDADDLLIGMRYQAFGWRGVYVPRILARGLTPVDWNSYLSQQLRWARSVIDVKCNQGRLVGKPISPIGRILSLIHGLFYLQNSVTTFLGLLLVAYLLAMADAPRVVDPSLLPGFILLCAALQACAFFRQKFFLDPGSEWGLHWRAALLRYAKWPIFLRAFWEAAMRFQVPYVLTPKIGVQSNSSMLFIPHLMIIAAIGAACGTGLLAEHRVPSLVYWTAAAIATASFCLILTGRFRFPAPFDRKLLSYGGD
jgi:cellulose synthase (UDP-forming)